MEENGFEVLPITFEDTLTLSTLPFHHRDPFDKIIIAQGITNRLTIISKDKSFALYKAPVFC
jgi:PIN domain nuclease of toxin-antitoxin system